MNPTGATFGSSLLNLNRAHIARSNYLKLGVVGRNLILFDERLRRIHSTHTLAQSFNADLDSRRRGLTLIIRRSE